MTTPKVTQPRKRVRTRRISPSQPPASAYHPVYSFQSCSEPNCYELHVPEATGSTKCPECLAASKRGAA